MCGCDDAVGNGRDPRSCWCDKFGFATQRCDDLVGVLGPKPPHAEVRTRSEPGPPSLESLAKPSLSGVGRSVSAGLSCCRRGTEGGGEKSAVPAWRRGYLIKTAIQGSASPTTRVIAREQLLANQQNYTGAGTPGSPSHCPTLTNPLWILNAAEVCGQETAQALLQLLDRQEAVPVAVPAPSLMEQAYALPDGQGMQGRGHANLVPCRAGRRNRPTTFLSDYRLLLLLLLMSCLARRFT